MSKTTFFKRIALVAIAALGLGMLSVAPSQAAAGTPSLTVSNGSASVTGGASNESTTAAVITVSGLLSTLGDSYTVKVFRKSAPTGGLADTVFRVMFLDTTTPTGVGGTFVKGSGSHLSTGAYDASLAAGAADSQTITANLSTPYTIGNTGASTNSGTGYVGAKFGIVLDSGTSRTDKEGTYTWTVQVTPYNAGSSTALTSVEADISFTINKTAAAAALASGTIDPSKTTAFLGTTTGATADASISVVNTADTTAHGYIRVLTKTSASLQAPESVTVTITGPGLVCVPDESVCGKSVTYNADGNDDFPIRADGTSGIASIVVKTTTVTFPVKTMTFYAEEAASITAAVNAPVINIGGNSDVIRATALDAEGNVWGGTAYIYASTAADEDIAGSNETPVACSFQAAYGFHACPVAGTAKGTASFKVIDTEDVADANATSNAVSVRVSTGVATTAKLSFDKATYAPGEKAQVRVEILDEAGLAMPYKVVTNAFTADIATSKAFFSGSLSGSASPTLDAATSATLDTNAGHDTYVVYMPMSNGVVTITATGSTGLALVGRVALSASATVTNDDPAVAAAASSAEAATDAALEAIDAANAATDAANLAAEAADAATVAAEEARDAADAATAAVEALAGEVATLMAALKAQITTLAKTVAKIAKKVKA